MVWVIKKRWRPHRKLRDAGQAAVWLTEDLKENRWVASKHFRLASDDAGEAILERFRREAERLQSVGESSRHVIAVYDYGFDDGHGDPFLVMEFAPHGSVQDLQAALAKDHARFPISLALKLIGQLCDGLHTAHERGIIHRDVKPANLLLAEGFDLRLADFGIAHHLLDATLTMTGNVIGSPPYIAAERWLDTDVDRRCDVFAIAVVAYELLCGRLPYSGRDWAATMRLILDGSPAAPSAVNPALPETVDNVLLAALSSDPARRPATAPEFAAALTAALATHEQHAEAETAVLDRAQARTKLLARDGDADTATRHMTLSTRLQPGRLAYKAANNPTVERVARPALYLLAIAAVLTLVAGLAYGWDTVGHALSPLWALLVVCGRALAWVLARAWGLAGLLFTVVVWAVKALASLLDQLGRWLAAGASTLAGALPADVWALLSAVAGLALWLAPHYGLSRAGLVGIMLALVIVVGMVSSSATSSERRAPHGAGIPSRHAFRAARKALVQKLLREQKRWSAHYRRHPNAHHAAFARRAFRTARRRLRAAHYDAAGRKRLRLALRRLRAWQQRRHRLVHRHAW